MKKQVGGDHYQLPIQPIEYIVKNDLPYIEGNIIKYVTRYKNKNGLEDLLKAQHYLQMLIDTYDEPSTESGMFNRWKQAMNIDEPEKES